VRGRAIAVEDVILRVVLDGSRVVLHGALEIASGHGRISLVLLLERLCSTSKTQK
jgi:hypothetical protein